MYGDDMVKLFAKFSGFVTAHIINICPDLTEAIEQWKESNMRAVGTIHRQSKLIFHVTINDAAKETHRLVKPKILESWLPIFVDCGEAYGSK
jgi:hypothetical protein